MMTTNGLSYFQAKFWWKQFKYGEDMVLANRRLTASVIAQEVLGITEKSVFKIV